MTLDQAMKVQQKLISEIIPYARNPRKNQEAIAKVAGSLKEFGWRQPIVIDSENVVIAGHTRLMAAHSLGMEKVPVVVADDLTPNQVKAYRLADNRVGQEAGWDDDLLRLEIRDLEDENYDISLTGFDLDELGDLFDEPEEEKYADGQSGSMAATYGVPPFSVLDTRQGHWGNLRDKWREKIGDKGESRENTLSKSDSNVMSDMNNGVSLFDPVLAELMVSWFGVEGGKTFDPFAGGILGFVTGSLGMEFHGIELRKEQAEINQSRCTAAGLPCTYHNDTSENMDKYVEDDSMDLVFTCPPYADLEVYSDDPRDLSNMSTQDFFKVYKKILQKTFAKLKNNRFAIVVMGEVRGKNGAYIGTIPKTIQIMEDAGYKFYNEIVLINSAGTLPLRAGKYMQATRKVGKMHQNVLVFLKGDAKAAVADLGPIDMNLAED